MRRRLIVVLGTMLVGFGLSAGVTPGAQAATTHQVRIDGSALFSRYFQVVGVTDWLETNQVQTVALEEGRSYRVSTTVTPADFTFSVDSAGHIRYAAENETFLGGADSETLVLEGLAVTVDARYLSSLGVLMVPATNDDWLRHATVRLLPAPGYALQQGSGVLVNFRPALQRDGTWSYDARYDIEQGGYVSGNGTSTLTLHGFVLLVDGRAGGGTGILVHSLWGLSFAPSGVQTVVLLPASLFVLQVRAGEITRARFAMDDHGQITFDPALPLAVDRYDGVRRLTVTAPL
jgi:hypothetical protein